MQKWKFTKVSICQHEEGIMFSFSRQTLALYNREKTPQEHACPIHRRSIDIIHSINYVIPSSSKEVSVPWQGDQELCKFTRGVKEAPHRMPIGSAWLALPPLTIVFRTQLMPPPSRKSLWVWVQLPPLPTLRTWNRENYQNKTSTQTNYQNMVCLGQ